MFAQTFNHLHSPTIKLLSINDFHIFVRKYITSIIVQNHLTLRPTNIRLFIEYDDIIMLVARACSSNVGGEAIITHS